VSEVRSFRQLSIVVLLLVSYLTPAMACMVSDVQMNAEETRLLPGLPLRFLWAHKHSIFSFDESHRAQGQIDFGRINDSWSDHFVDAELP
jgi:hypothetical protein